MGRLLGSLFNLRSGERPLALWMALYHVLLLVSLYLLKPVRDSLFLSSRGPDELPFVFILTTIVVVPVAWFHARAGRRMRVGALIDGASLILVVSLVGMRGLLGVGGAWTAYLLYAWVSIYGLVVTSQFWLLANALFTAAQSKRVFSVLSAGAILGAIVGGEVTGLLVDAVGMSSENLLLAAAAVLGAATGLGAFLRRQEDLRAEGTTADDSPDADADGALSIIQDSRHIQLIVGGLALMVIVTTLVDYQFKTVAARAYPSEEALTAFMGRFYGRVSIVALLVQFVLAPRLMRVVGIGGALSVLPATLALGSLGMLVMPGLLAGVFLRGAGQSLKHSLDKTGRELLFVPVSLGTKKRVKVFVDLFVDQGAQGIGGLLLVGLAYGAGLSVQMLSLGVLGLIVLWAGLTYGVRETYVDQFREKLRRRVDTTDGAAEEGPEEPTGDLDDILDSLCGLAETEVLRALKELETHAGPVPVEVLLCLLDHPSAPVRERAVRVLRVREVESVADRVAEALRDPDPDVQLAAARYLYCQLTDDHLERLRQGLRHDDPQIQAATVGLIAEEGGVEEHRLVSESLLRRLVTLEGERGREARTQVARVLGVIDAPYCRELLHELLQDEAPPVVRAALRSAGRCGDRSFVVPLVQALGDDAYEAAAREGLEAFGDSIFGTLYDYLVDETQPLALRQRLPSLFAAAPTRLAITLLGRALRQVSGPVRHAVVRALNAIRRTDGTVLDADLLDAVIEHEIEHYAALGQIERLHRRDGEASAFPLTPTQIRSLREETLERIFRLLGMRYDQDDIYDAYLGITSADAALRDNAIEFVDNLVEYNIRRMLMPLLDDPTAERAVEIGEQFFDRSITSPAAAQRYLEGLDDPRVAALLDGADELGPAVPSGDDLGARPVPVSASEE
jgi:ATP/ADP translocase/HEAT repeat protein